MLPAQGQLSGEADITYEGENPGFLSERSKEPPINSRSKKTGRVEAMVSMVGEMTPGLGRGLQAGEKAPG